MTPMLCLCQETINLNVNREANAADLANASANIRSARAAEAAAMSSKNINIKVPLNVNLADYTHIAIADVLNSQGSRAKIFFKRVKSGLMSSPMTILSPTDDKKKFKKNSFYLRDIKDPKWIYLYYSASRIGVDLNVSITLRDYQNKIIYQATFTNEPFLQVLNDIANMI
jgi:hypothetical protein